MKPVIISCFTDSIISDLKKYNIIRDGTNKPEIRQKIIIEHLSKKYDIITVSMDDNKSSNENILKRVHDSNYIDFLKGAYDNFEEYDDEYKSKDGGLVPANLSKNDKHIHKLQCYRRIGFYANDFSTPIYKNTFSIINLCTIVAQETTKYIDKAKTIYCSMTYPGHHAKTKEYGGYCFVNNASIVAISNLDKFDNVCFLDLDYHAGDGTHEIVENLSKEHKNKKFLSVSIHADPKYDYPSFTGYEDENTDNVNNIIFPKKSSIDEYMKCLSIAIKNIQKTFNNEKFLLIIPFGADTYTNDTDASKFYGCGLNIGDYLKIGRSIRNSFRDTPIIITQEGGYFMEDVPQIVDNFLTGLNTST